MLKKKTDSRNWIDAPPELVGAPPKYLLLMGPRKRYTRSVQNEPVRFWFDQHDRVGFDRKTTRDIRPAYLWPVDGLKPGGFAFVRYS